MSNYIYNPDSGELYHYGVKGMKWGVRKRPEYVESARANMKNARAARTSANIDRRVAQGRYNDSFNRAYNYSSAHPVTQWTGKNKTMSDRLWDEATKDAAASRKADKAYKEAKGAHKQAKNEYREAKKQRNKEINNAADDIRKKESFASKMTYNSATYRQAGKYVVDHNMSVAEATKKAKGDAWRNTAAFVAVYGAVAVGSTIAAKR